MWLCTSTRRMSSSIPDTRGSRLRSSCFAHSIHLSLGTDADARSSRRGLQSASTGLSDTRAVLEAKAQCIDTPGRLSKLSSQRARARLPFLSPQDVLLVGLPAPRALGKVSRARTRSPHRCVWDWAKRRGSGWTNAKLAAPTMSMPYGSARRLQAALRTGSLPGASDSAHESGDGENPHPRGHLSR